MLFGRSSMLTSLVLVVALTATAKAQDLFPDKLESQYSTGWTVTYSDSFKVIEGPAIGKIVAYQSGTPPPTIEGATTVVEIPLATVTLLSTSYIPFFEILGRRSSIIGIANTEAVSSACLQAAITAGTCGNIGSENWAPSITDINTVGADATFSGTYNMAGLGPIDGVAIPMAEEAEMSGIASAEWLEYVALFFNDELAASTHIEEVSQRIAAAEAAVVTAIGDAAPKKVLWVYEYYGTLYSGSCPNYYCEAIAQAGGEIMDLSSIGDPAAWGGITNFTLFYEMAAEADIWLYPSNNWDAVSLDADALSLLPAVMNDQVYDITGNNLCMDGDCDTANDWFESRLAEPDVLLEDLISIIMPEVHMDHGRVWFRNVATEERGSARTCSDPASPYLFHADDVVPGAAADAICVEDLTGDGIVGVDDLLQLLSAYGRGC